MRLLDALRAEERDKKVQEHQKKRPKTATPRLTPVDARSIEEAAAKSHEKHLRVLKDVDAALRTMRDFTPQFQRVASLVVRLGYDYPRIKWSLRLALHEAAVDIEDMPAWQAIDAMRWRAVDAEPLQALIGLGRVS